MTLLSRWPAAAVLGVLCTAAYGCGDITVPRDLSAPMQTDALLYKVRVTQGTYETTTWIGYVFSNPQPASVYVEANCGRQAPPSLEKNVLGTWVPAWSAAIGLCKGPPIVIPSGQAYEDSLRVYAGARGSNTFPQFQVEDIGGVYRLVWHNVSVSQGGAEIPIEQRVSNQFVLSLE